jgi:hypothetical protein
LNPLLCPLRYPDFKQNSSDNLAPAKPFEKPLWAGCTGRGGTIEGVIVVDDVILLAPGESVRLDQDRLGGLYTQLGEAGAEDVICRAVEELAVRLSHSERLWRAGNWNQLRKSTRSLVAIADQVGMCQLARAARGVTRAIDADDPVAVSSTLARLLRIGEKSLTAVWDLRDLSL